MGCLVAVGLWGCGDDVEPTPAAGTSTSAGLTTTASTSTSTTNPATTTASTTAVDTSSGTSSGRPIAEGSFEILTYNVAGLPQGISSSNPEAFIPQISPLLNAFPLVLVQEDFWFHGQLTADIEHPHRSEPNPADPVREGIGDGLNRFSQFPFEPVARTQWPGCNGQLDCASDCLARKGWSFARTTVDEGVEIDVYNLHMEAGGCPEDLEIRQRSAEEIVAALEDLSAERAVVVAGDFNLRADDPEDVDALGTLFQTGLRDACVEVDCGDERIDKILIRDGDRVALRADAWRVPREFVDAREGGPLSDHLPVAAVLHYGPR